MNSLDGDNESLTNKPSDVLLGFVDVPITNTEQPGIEDTFIGGVPVWLHPDSPAPKEMLLCKNCGKTLRLLSQTYASLSGSWADRIIYIFGCNEPLCRRKRGSVRAIRAVRRDPKVMQQKEIEYKVEEARAEQEAKATEERKKKTKEITKDLFGTSTGSNPFGGNPFGNPFEKLEKLKKAKEEIKQADIEEDLKDDAPVEVDATEYRNEVPKHAALTKALGAEGTTPLSSFPGQLLFVEEEVFDPRKRQLPEIPQNLQLDESISEESLDEKSPGSLEGPPARMSSKINTGEAEEFAKAMDDPTFRHFTDVVSYNPRQVLRYHHNGYPLLYTAKDDVAKVFYDEHGKLRKAQNYNLPRPGYHPNGTRVFELQLMPQAIGDLEANLNIDILTQGMEWGTIMVATDADDFVPDAYFDEHYVAYVEEWCGVQWEEEIKRK